MSLSTFTELNQSIQNRIDYIKESDKYDINQCQRAIKFHKTVLEELQCLSQAITRNWVTRKTIKEAFSALVDHIQDEIDHLKNTKNRMEVRFHKTTQRNLRSLQRSVVCGCKRRNKSKSGFKKEIAISSELACFLGVGADTMMSRVECWNRLRDYIVQHNLLNADNRREIFPDKALTELLDYNEKPVEQGGHGPLYYHVMIKLINKHFIKDSSFYDSANKHTILDIAFIFQNKIVIDKTPKVISLNLIKPAKLPNGTTINRVILLITDKDVTVYHSYNSNIDEEWTPQSHMRDFEILGACTENQLIIARGQGIGVIIIEPLGVYVKVIYDKTQPVGIKPISGPWSAVNDSKVLNHDLCIGYSVLYITCNSTHNLCEPIDNRDDQRTPILFSTFEKYASYDE